MRARTALPALALALAAVPARALECRTFTIGGDVTVSSVKESPGVAIGFDNFFTFRCLAASLSLDMAADDPRSEPGFDTMQRAGLGAMVDLHPRVAAYALVVGGAYRVAFRDVIKGGWRGSSYDAAAWGGTAGVFYRAYTTRSGRWAIPIVGASATMLHVARGSDRLRGVTWGGWQPIFTLSLGIEGGKPRR